MAGKDGSLNFDTKIDSSGFQKGIDSLGNAAQKGLSVTGKVLGGAATAVTALGGAAIKVGSDFESGMSQVQAVSGASGEALEELKEKAKEMGTKTKFSATEAAEAMNYMAMAGWKTEDMLSGIDGIMNLAAASGEDLAATSDIVTDALTAFGLSAADSTHFADILAAASSNANTNVGLMGETFKYVAPLAGSLGYSAEDTATAIGLMANAGIKGSQAGTALRSIMTRLAKPTKESQEAMDALGLSITDSSGKMKPLSDIVADMREGFSGLTEDEKASYAAMLGGQEAMSGLLAIVNASDKDFEKLSGAINDCNGSAAEMAEIMQDNLQGQITILQSGLEGLGVSLYETMQDMAKDVVKEAQGMVQQLQDAFNEDGFQGLFGAFGSVLAQIVQRIAEAAPTVIEAAVSLVKSFCDGLKNAPGVGDSGAGLITSLVTGLMSCVGEIWTTAIVLIGKLAEGIAAALPTLITQAAAIVTDMAMALVNNLPALVDAAVQLVMGLVQGLVDGTPVLLEGAIQLFMAILDALPVIIEQLLQALPGLITTIIDFFVENLPVIVDGAVQLLMGIIDAIPVIIQAIVNNLPQIITALVNGLVSALPQLLEAAVTLLMAIIQAIPDIVVAIADNLPQIITAIAAGLADAIPLIFTTAKDLLWQIIKAVPEVVSGLAAAVPNIISGIVNGLIGGIGAVKDAALALGSSILDGIKGFFGIHSPSTVMTEQGDYLVQGLINGIANMPAELAAYLDQTVQKIIAWGQQMFSSVQNTIQNVVNTAVNLIAQLPGKIWTWLVNTVTKVTAWGQQMLSTAKTAIQNMISSIISLLSELPGKVWTWLVNTVTKVTAWGQQMLSTAKTAISNMISNIISLMAELPGKAARELAKVVSGVVSWGTELASKGSTAAKGLFDAVVNGVIGLPSKMAEIGSNIVSGIWDGISSGWDWLKGKVSDLAGGLLSAAKGALGIHSPSKAFRDEFGRWLMPGTVEGVKKSMPKTLREMKEQAGELLAAMQGTVNASMGRISLNASGTVEARLLTSAGTVVYNDNHQEQENNYHVPVASPSETAKAQREAFRKMSRGVK